MFPFLYKINIKLNSFRKKIKSFMPSLVECSTQIEKGNSYIIKRRYLNC